MIRTKFATIGMLAATSTIALTSGHALAQDATDASAESIILVTGSRIPRSEEIPPASPLEVISATEIENAAPATIATFLKDIPSNFGSTFASGRGFGGGDSGIGTVNLRGLGASASLVLLNGQRTATAPDQPDNVVDVNLLIPQIMISRVEVVKDGASALYGSDAVAGVVNFITDDHFEGLRMLGRASEYTYSGEGDRRLEAMFGSDLGGQGHFVVAASYFDQDLMLIADDIPSLEGRADNPRFSSPSSNPGVFSVPTRDANGLLTSTRRNRVDPTCGMTAGTFPSNGQTVDGVPVVQSAVGPTTTQCRYLFFTDQAAQAAIEQFQIFGRFNYDLFDNVELSSDFGYSVSDSYTYYVAGAPMSLTGLVVPGHNPGNLYRAVDGSGAPLYAVSSGVSAGFSRDGNEVFLPLRNGAGQVVLSNDPTNPSSGIPFYEDVLFTGRAVGFQCGLPTGGTADPGDCTQSRPSETDTTLIRGALGLSGQMFSDWTWNTGVTYSRSSLATNGDSPGTALATQLRNSLQGLGGPNCTGTVPGRNGCLYYNIAGSSAFATAPGDPRANSQAVLDYIFPLMVDRFRSSLLVGDASLAGELPGLAAGPIGVALGYQMRRVGLNVDYDANKNIRNVGSNTIFFDVDLSRTTHAVFGEVRVPLVDSGIGYAELSGAVRHERGAGYSTTDPKVGISYVTQNGLLSIRGTYGTSFVAPSLFRLSSVSGTSGQINDVCSNPACTGLTSQVIQVQTQGNPNLRPETSENINAGLTLAPTDNLSFSVDWWRYQFEDRIATETPQSVLLADPDGSLTGRVVRGANGQVLQINAQYFNASRVVTTGFDFAAAFRQDLGDLGDVRLRANATYVPVYRWQLSPTAPAINYAGQVPDNGVQNRLAVIATSPEWRGLLNFDWTRGQHSIAATLHYIDGVVFNPGGRVSATLNVDAPISSWTTLDLTYSFTPFEGRETGLLSELKFQIGANNVFNAAIPELPPPATQSFLANIHDTRGRMVWAAISLGF